MLRHVNATSDSGQKAFCLESAASSEGISRTRLSQDGRQRPHCMHRFLAAFCPMAQPLSAVALRTLSVPLALGLPIRGLNLSKAGAGDVAVPMLMNCGDAVLLNTRIFHCGSANTSEKTRVQLRITYVPSTGRWTINNAVCLAAFVCAHAGSIRARTHAVLKSPCLGCRGYGSRRPADL